MGIILILVGKNGGGDHRWKIKDGLSKTLKMCQIIRVKCLIFLTKVNISSILIMIIIPYIDSNFNIPYNIPIICIRKIKHYQTDFDF